MIRKSRKEGISYKRGWRVFDVVALICIGVTLYIEPVFIFVVVPGLIIIYRLLPNREKKALWYSKKLPTSKISSLAIGLVELKGQAHLIKPLAGPRSIQQCIGYLYVIEEERESEDSDGKKSYSWSEIHRESDCAPFRLTDDSGEILIEAKDIDFIKIPITNVITQSKVRYNEYLLLDQMYVLVIGYATAENDQKIIIKDAHNDVFSVSDVDEISAWELYDPLINSFLIMIFFVFLIMVFILIS